MRESSKMLRYVHAKMNPELNYKTWYHRFYRKYRVDGEFTLEYVKYKSEYYKKEFDKMAAAKKLEEAQVKKEPAMMPFHPVNNFGEIK